MRHSKLICNACLEPLGNQNTVYREVGGFDNVRVARHGSARGYERQRDGERSDDSTFYQELSNHKANPEASRRLGDSFRLSHQAPGLLQLNLAIPESVLY